MLLVDWNIHVNGKGVHITRISFLKTNQFGLPSLLPFRYTRILWQHAAGVLRRNPAHSGQRPRGTLLTLSLEGELPYSHVSFTTS